jgi:hypothetical protein
MGIDPAMLGGSGGLAAMMGGPLGWAMLGTNVLGGLFGGMSEQRRFQQQMDMERKKLREQQNQFDRSQGFTEEQYGRDLRRSMDAAPMRDRASYMLNARMGMNPGQFNPQDMFQPGSKGGVNLGQLQNANRLYRPGSGGTLPSQARDQQLLSSLGYGPVRNARGGR